MAPTLVPPDDDDALEAEQDVHVLHVHEEHRLLQQPAHRPDPHVHSPELQRFRARAAVLFESAARESADEEGATGGRTARHESSDSLAARGAITSAKIANARNAILSL